MVITATCAPERYLCLDVPNRRVKLLDGSPDVARVARAAVALASSNGLEKIWGFVSSNEWKTLSGLGFVQEGTLDDYFADGPGIGVAKYLCEDRAKSRHTAEENKVLRGALAQAHAALSPTPDEYTFRIATKDDCQHISDTLTTVFTSYPTPIDSAGAIAAAMDRDVAFMLAESQGRVVSVMSADIDRGHRVAEMTDCATLPQHRGRGLMQALLAQMEEQMRRAGLRSLFTLARATSAGMNIAFARLSYAYRGRFINNCHIAGAWEDMNLWVKPLTHTE